MKLLATEVAMKLNEVSLVTRAGLMVLFFLVSFYPAQAQEARLHINHLDKLAEKADETVDVNIDGPLLEMASKFFSSSKPEEAKAKDLISGLKGIYVRSFEFENEGAYSSEDVEAIRKQIRPPDWVRLVGVRSKKDKENVEVFTRMEAGKVMGLAIISSEPKELTVVNVVGSIDIEKLSELEGQLGIPKLGLEQSGKSRKE
jgi:hypothetical protein